MRKPKYVTQENLEEVQNAILKAAVEHIKFPKDFVRSQSGIAKSFDKDEIDKYIKQLMVFGELPNNN